MPPPPQPARAGTGVGSGIGVGRGVGKGIGRGVPPPPAPVAAPASPATAPTAPPPPPPARKQPKNQRGKDKGERGNLIEAPTPVYPIEARRQRIEGTVRLKITIDEDGNVISATPQSGPEALQGASQDAAYKARFQPTTKEGKPVKVEATLAYNFVIAKH